MKRLFYLFAFIGLLRVLKVNGSVIKGKVTDPEGNSLAGTGITIDNSFLETY